MTPSLSSTTTPFASEKDTISLKIKHNAPVSVSKYADTQRMYHRGLRVRKTGVARPATHNKHAIRETLQAVSDWRSGETALQKVIAAQNRQLKGETDDADADVEEEAEEEGKTYDDDDDAEEEQQGPMGPAEESEEERTDDIAEGMEEERTDDIAEGMEEERTDDIAEGMRDEDDRNGNIMDSIENEADILTVLSMESSSCGGSQWTTSIAIGSPPQVFNVAIDTASSDLWVTSTNCDETCKDQIALYDRKESDTYAAYKAPRQVVYRGKNAYGKYALDYLQVGGIVMQNHRFAHVRTFTEDLSMCEDVSGVLGLNIFNTDHPQLPSFLEELLPFLKFPIFSLYLNTEINNSANSESDDEAVPPMSELVLGGVNMLHYDGCLSWHKSGQFKDDETGDAIENYWDFGLDKIFVGDTELENPPLMAIVDSSSPNIIAPSDAVRTFAIANEMTCYTLDDSGDLGEELDCENEDEAFDVMVTDCDHKEPQDFVNLVFVADDNSYEFNMFELSRTYLDDDTKKMMCSPQLIASDDIPLWVMGIPFLSKYYTAFKVDSLEIGFADTTMLRSSDCADDLVIDVTYTSDPSSLFESSREDDTMEMLDEAVDDDDADEIDNNEETEHNQEIDENEETDDDASFEESEIGANREKNDEPDMLDLDTHEEYHDLIDESLLNSFDPNVPQDATAIAMENEVNQTFRENHNFQKTAAVATLLTFTVFFLVASFRKKRQIAKEKRQFAHLELGSMMMPSDIELFSMNDNLELS